MKRALLQKLRRDFELLEMKESESVEEYFTRVLRITNQMRSNGEEMMDSKVMEKILRTLSEKFTYVVISIEESKDTESITLEELQNSLMVHEKKIKRTEKEDDHVLKVTHGRGAGTRGRGFTGRGRGRDRGIAYLNNSTIECYNFHRLGHFQNEYQKWEEESNYGDLEENEEILLMAYLEEQPIEGSDNNNMVEKSLMTRSGNQENIRRCAWFLIHAAPTI